jgi:hypothetical protein
MKVFAVIVRSSLVVTSIVTLLGYGEMQDAQRSAERLEKKVNGKLARLKDAEMHPSDRQIACRFVTQLNDRLKADRYFDRYSIEVNDCNMTVK